MFLELQLNYLLWLQNIRTVTNDILTPFFFCITGFGEYLLPILTCAVIYWCIDKKLGALIILNTAFSLMINQLLKSMACLARPWVLDSRIKPVDIALPHAGGYSFPSGHSTLAVACWGSLGLWYRNNKKILYSSIILCLLIAFSRNYLGVHTLQDILIGLLVAVIILIGSYKTLNWCEVKKNRDLIIAITVSIIGALIAAHTYFKSYPIVESTLNSLIPNSEHSKWAGFPKLGFILGSFWGWYIERNFVKFDPKCGNFKTKIIRLIVGLILFIPLILYSGVLLKHCLNKHLGSFLYMLLVSLFITLIYPWIITKIKPLHK